MRTISNRVRTVLCGISQVLVMALALTSGDASAAYTCTVTVTNINIVFEETVAADNVTTGSFNINCTRAAGDSSMLAWSLASNNGQNNNGGNRVRRTPPNTYYRYDTYIPPYTGGVLWQGANRFTGTLNFGASLSASTSGVFEIGMPSPQTSVTAGTYTDTLLVTLRNTGNNSTLDTVNYTVTVVTTNSCQITAMPGNITINYVAFQAAAATSNTTFRTRCSFGLPYTLSIDALAGSLVGLNYTLALSATNATGDGAEQTFTITGSVAGLQAGTCATGSCAGSATRTLTVTY